MLLAYILNWLNQGDLTDNYRYIVYRYICFVIVYLLHKDGSKDVIFSILNSLYMKR
jgi:hypothetical protein